MLPTTMREVSLTSVAALGLASGWAPLWDGEMVPRLPVQGAAFSEPTGGGVVGVPWRTGMIWIPLGGLNMEEVAISWLSGS